MFKTEKRRREFKVFKMLSQYLGTKTQAQCKSHHQKMIKRYSTLNNIIDRVTKRAEKANIGINYPEIDDNGDDSPPQSGENQL